MRLRPGTFNHLTNTLAHKTASLFPVLPYKVSTKAGAYHVREKPA